MERQTRFVFLRLLYKPKNRRLAGAGAIQNRANPLQIDVDPFAFWAKNRPIKPEKPTPAKTVSLG